MVLFQQCSLCLSVNSSLFYMVLVYSMCILHTLCNIQRLIQGPNVHTLLDSLFLTKSGTLTSKSCDLMLVFKSNIPWISLDLVLPPSPLPLLLIPSLACSCLQVTYCMFSCLSLESLLMSFIQIFPCYCLMLCCWLWVVSALYSWLLLTLLLLGYVSMLASSCSTVYYCILNENLWFNFLSLLVS